jgi:hypothetical protein
MVIDLALTSEKKSFIFVMFEKSKPRPESFSWDWRSAVEEIEPSRIAADGEPRTLATCGELDCSKPCKLEPDDTA